MKPKDKLVYFCDYFNLKPTDFDFIFNSENDKQTFIDQEGYKYYLSIDNMKVTKRRNGKFARFFNNNPYTDYNITVYLKANNYTYEIFDFDNCVNAKSKMRLKCNICGQVFESTWNQIQHKVGCTFCSKNKLKERSIARRYCIDEIKDYLEKYNVILLEKEYVGNDKKMKCFCYKHGEFIKDWINIRKSKHPCPNCSNESRVIDKETPMKKINSSIDKNKYTVVGEYVNCKTKIEILCLDCGETFFVRPDHLKNGQGCPCKSPISKGEEKIKEVLLNKKVAFISQKTFKDCTGKSDRPLRFDFYLTEQNTLIEFQGIQHYKPVELFGGEEGFINIQKNDNIKRNWTSKNKIKLVEIKYDEYDKIQEIIESLI